MKIPLKTFLLATIVAAALSGPVCADHKELKIGLIPEMNVFKQMARFKPLAKYLSEETGATVNFTILSRYGNIIDSFTAEKLDGAFFGSFTGALAIQKLGVTPLARPVNLDGESTYHAHLYVRKDSPIRKAADMQGKRFAFVDKATTAGYLFPIAYLKESAPVNIDTFFSEYFFAGSHDAALYAVLNKEADIGASKNTVYDWVAMTEPRIEKEITILAESSNVPSNGLCVRKDLDETFKEKLKSALLQLEQHAAGKEVLNAFKALRFIETTVEDYLPVFEMAEKAGIRIEAYEYRNE